MTGHIRRTSNPATTSRRVLRLANALLRNYRELGVLFGVSEDTIRSWVSGRYVPSLKHQRTLELLEQEHRERLGMLGADDLLRTKE